MESNGCRAADDDSFAAHGLFFIRCRSNAHDGGGPSVELIDGRTHHRLPTSGEIEHGKEEQPAHDSGVRSAPAPRPDPGAVLEAASAGSRYESGRGIPAPVRELLRLAHVEGIDLRSLRGEDWSVVSYLKEHEPELYATLRRKSAFS